MRFGDVADDPDDAFFANAPAASQLLEPPLGPLANQHVDCPLALEQQLDQIAADEARRAGDEVVHPAHRKVRNFPLARPPTLWGDGPLPGPIRARAATR